MGIRIRSFRWVALSLIGGMSLALGEVRLPAIFSDGAVLANSGQVPVWGWAAPGEEVTVSVGKATAKAVADGGGKWKAALDLSASEQGPFDLLIRGTNELKVKDVLVGEVWVCAGQSNMEMRLGTTHATDVMARAQNPRLRHFKVEKKSTDAPVDDVVGKWVASNPKDSGEFTAVGYYFGQRLQEEIGRPVGLINLSWGGSLAESWTSPEALASDNELKRQCEIWRAQANPVGKAPIPNKVPSALFNGMLSPILPYAISGAIWYQGESNARAGMTAIYTKALATMVRDWRARWQSGDFPFYLCQLPNFQPKSPDPGQVSVWAELREAQAKFLETEKTGMAVLIDVGEEKGLHPRNKKDPGERLARIALAKKYGKSILFSGPVFASAEVEGDRIRVRFSSVNGSLAVAPLPPSYALTSSDPEKTVPLVRNSPDSEVEGFAICGEDRKWIWAKAKIEGADSVVVSSPKVSKPLAVRYAWASNPTCNLTDGSGLPAGPFRTDSFPTSQLSSKALPADNP